MKKVLTSVFIFVLAFLTLSVTNVSAKILSSKNGDVTVAKTEVVNDDLFIGAQSAVIDGTVNGDVFVGAQTVKITGVVNGNLHAGGNTIDLSGTVKGNVYAGGQNIMVSSAKIGGSLLVGSATVNVDKNSTIGGSVMAGAGNISIDSQVKRSAYLGAGTITLGSDARIGRDLYYSSGNNQANISTSAKIAGTVYKSEVKTASSSASMEAAKKQMPAILSGIRFGSTIISFLGALIVGLIYLKLFGKHFTQTAGTVTKSFWKSMGIGFLVTIAALPALIILLITVIGIPVAGLGILIFLLYAYLAKIVFGSAFGTWAAGKMKWKMSTYWAFALGLLLIYVLKMIPVVGFLTGLVVFWVGLGALTLQIFSKEK